MDAQNPAGHLDSSPLAKAPWVTPRRLILFTIGWLAAYSVFTVFISNPFRAEPAAGVPPDYWKVMVEHGLLIGFVGLLALFALQVFAVRSLHVRAWICAGVVAATVLASVGGIFDTRIPGAEVALWTQIFGFFALDEILILLFWGIWRERSTAVASSGLLPVAAALAATASMFAAAILGHAAGWFMEFGYTPAFLGSYASFAGFASIADFQAALVGSHSHQMAVAAMALAITLLAVQFGYRQLGGFARAASRLGMGAVFLGTFAMGVFYTLTGVSSLALPDALSQIGSAPNAIPTDDLLTGILVMGGGLVVALAFLPALRRSAVRAAAAWAWLLSVATVAASGYSIELHTSFFGAGDPLASGAGADAIFTWFHQDIGLFVLPAVLLVMLIAERTVTRSQSASIGALAIAGTSVLFAGGMFWVFANPSLYGPGYWIATLGLALTGAAILATVWHGGLRRAVGHPSLALPRHPTARGAA